MKFPELGDSLEIGMSVFFSVLKDIPGALEVPNNGSVSIIFDIFVFRVPMLNKAFYFELNSR